MTSPSRAPVTMTTFAPTLDSEQARLLLAYYGIRYRERDHLMPFVLLPALLHGGGTTIPLVYGKGVRTAGPRALAEHYDALVPAEHRLIPAEQPLAGQV